jgi:hypothetical protein
MIEILEIKNPIEQDLSVVYGDRNIVLELRWNDTRKYWYFNLKENNSVLISGVTMVCNCNLLYPELNLGKLYLIDTKTDDPAPLKKTDLGTRLAVAREY